LLNSKPYNDFKKINEKFLKKEKAFKQAVIYFYGVLWRKRKRRKKDVNRMKNYSKNVVQGR